MKGRTRDEPFTDLPVKVQPRASRSELAGTLGDTLKIRIAAPPVDGAANEELIRLLASALGIPRSRVEIRRGGSGRSKVVRIHGLDPAQVRAALGT